MASGRLLHPGIRHEDQQVVRSGLRATMLSNAWAGFPVADRSAAIGPEARAAFRAAALAKRRDAFGSDAGERVRELFE